MNRYLFLLIALGWIWFFARYYRRQNGGQRIGGPISKPKAVWLGLTTYLYFVFPWVVFFAPHISAPVKAFAVFFAGLLLGRAVFQSIWMFSVKKWSPPMGMGFNLCISASLMFWPKAGEPLAYLLMMLWVGLMLTDTLFAWQFFRIVGTQTKGDRAIWYADDTPRFRWINQQTMVADVLFLGYFLYICGNFF